MIKNFCKNNWQIILCNFVLLLVFILGYGHFGDANVDSFREAYLPAQMLKGQVLYRNTFTIYAPLSYIINAVLYFIFGINLKVLYFAGFIASVGIINLTFMVAKLFMNKTYAMSIVLFLISVSVMSPNVFNFIFPYSYGILYGLLFIMASVYFALKSKFTWAYLLYSLAICCKYEFIFLLPLLLFETKNKNLLKNLVALLAPIVLVCGILLFHGVEIESIKATVQIILKMSSTKTLYWFYSVMGLICRWELIPIYILNFIKVLVPFLFIYYFRSWWIIVLATIYFYFAANAEILIYAFPLILIMLIARRRDINGMQMFFVIASLLISIKIFFAETLLSYGVFFVPFALISIFILIPPRFKKSLFIILLICSFVFGLKNVKNLRVKNTKLQTENGVFYTNSAYGNSIGDLIKYIQNNTAPSDRVVVYPEGLIVNFLANRDSDNKFYSLIPLYVETFGEELIAKRFEYMKPEYIVISNYNTSNYYYSYFGQDYAGNLYEYIIKNYTYEKDMGKDLRFSVYKRKN